MSDAHDDTFRFSDRVQSHQAGDAHCDACPERYPIRCRCGGLIHAEPGKSSPAGPGIAHLNQACDRCGENWEHDLED